MSTITMTAQEQAELDALLDGTLDDLADVPSFKPFPVGAHRVTIKWETKLVSGKVAFELELTAVETVELTNPEDTPVTAGDSTNVLFIMKKADGTKNELAEGQMKVLLKVLGEHFGTTSTRDTMAASNGAEVMVFTSVRADKRDKQAIKYYTSVDNLAVV